MAGLASLFSGSTFKSTILSYASQNGWKVAEISDKMATLKFNMQSGRTQTVYIIRYDSTLEFSVPSFFGTSSEDDIPGMLSTILLRRNAERKTGFWCIEKLGSRYVFSCMHNAETELINGEYFARIIRALINECDDFEGILIKMGTS